MLSDQFLVEMRLDRTRIPSFDAYPFSLNAVRNLDALPLHRSVTFIVGENGSGKSTLLEALAVAWGFNAEGGTQNFRFDTRESHSPLHDYVQLSRGYKKPHNGYFLRAESFYNVATEIEELDKEPGGRPGGRPIIASYGGVSLHAQSHGESFLALLLHRFSGNGFYILDEPEAALSPTRQMSALVRIHQLVRAGAQFVISTHSPILMAYPEAWIYYLDEDGITRIIYEETEHYQLTRDFLNNHQMMLKVLLAD
jgi:predicted ATPase